MLTKPEHYYARKLQRYFEMLFFEYEESVKFYVNPAINKWKFDSPELGIRVTLTCDDDGQVFERREQLK